MTELRRIQRQRSRGWRMPQGAIYVGRPSRWGNPFRLGETYMWLGSPRDWPVPTARQPGLYDYGILVERLIAPDTAIAWFEAWARTMLHGEPAWLAPLRGRVLACWCPLSQPCHADVLLELANA